MIDVYFHAQEAALVKFVEQPRRSQQITSRYAARATSQLPDVGL